VLIAILKKAIESEASLYTLLQIFSVSVFEKIELQRSFAQIECRILNGFDHKLLRLFSVPVPQNLKCASG
jgi:hypothetical protein